MGENLIGTIVIVVILGAALYFWYKRQKSIMNMVDDEESVTDVVEDTKSEYSESETTTEIIEEIPTEDEPRVKRKARKNYGTKKNRNSKRHND